MSLSAEGEGAGEGDEGEAQAARVRASRNVISRDDGVDDAFNEIKEKLADMIYGGKLDAKTGLDLLMTAKYFERIGDHAVNISEWVEFSITGQHRNNEHQDYVNN